MCIWLDRRAFPGGEGGAGGGRGWGEGGCGGGAEDTCGGRMRPQGVGRGGGRGAGEEAGTGHVGEVRSPPGRDGGGGRGAPWMGDTMEGGGADVPGAAAKGPAAVFSPYPGLTPLAGKTSPVTLPCGLISEDGIGGGGGNPRAYAGVYPPWGGAPADEMVEPTSLEKRPAR